MENKIKRELTTYMGKLHKLHKSITTPKAFTTDYLIKVETSYNGFIQKHNAFIEFDTIDKKSHKTTNESSIIIDKQSLSAFITALQKVEKQINELESTDLEAAKALSKIRDNENKIKEVYIEEIDTHPLQGMEEIIHCYKLQPFTNDPRDQNDYPSVYANIHLSGVRDIDKKVLVPLIGNVTVKYDAPIANRGHRYLEKSQKEAMEALDKKIESMKAMQNNKK